jgi:hypothetical protein
MIHVTQIPLPGTSLARMKSFSGSEEFKLIMSMIGARMTQKQAEIGAAVIHSAHDQSYEGEISSMRREADVLLACERLLRDLSSGDPEHCWRSKTEYLQAESEASDS